jgi:hypothetical protein
MVRPDEETLRMPVKMVQRRVFGFGKDEFWGWRTNVTVMKKNKTNI